MQIIGLIHNCLHFKFNKRKYLFGLTTSLLQDVPAITKIKTDFVILPSYPYLIDQSLFLWQLQCLSQLNCETILLQDLTVKKRVEAIIPLISSLSINTYKWEVFKQHELTEDQLIKVYDQYRLKVQSKPLCCEPNGLGFNKNADILNLNILEWGYTIVAVHQTDTILIDPCQNIEGMLKNYGIPFNSLRALILSRPNMNIFQLLCKLEVIYVITSQKIYAQLRKQLKSLFHWDEQMLSKRLRGKILVEQLKISKYRNLQFSFRQNKLGALLYLDMVFGLKRIRVYTSELDHYPTQIMNLRDLQYLVAYEIIADVKKQLQSSPEAYRKKIIYNRPVRKYNNKYFYTLRSAFDIVSIKSHPYKSDELVNTLQDLSFLYKQKDPNYKIAYKSMSNQEKFNSKGRNIYVRSGYVKDEQGNIHGIDSKLTSTSQITAINSAKIMYEENKNAYFYSGRDLVDPQFYLTAEDILKKVKQNSFVRLLNRKNKNIGDNSDPQLIQLGSEWQVLNSICNLKTFEAGFDLGKSNYCVYLVVKGCMKYQLMEGEATKSMFIGNIKRYYNSIYQQNDEISVIKDTWAIQINVKQLHNKFFTHFPSRMYQLFTRPNLFL